MKEERQFSAPRTDIGPGLAFDRHAYFSSWVGSHAAGPGGMAVKVALFVYLLNINMTTEM